MKKTAVIIGAGPAGLTAAYQLVTKTDIKPIILEKSQDIGGISKTVNYKGNRIDIGGHRFFSKSTPVMKFWKNILPIEEKAPDKKEKIFLVRSRLSRILYLRKFFDYPISLSIQTIRNLGIFRMTRIGFSYIKARIKPIRHEKSLEDFIINRFGKKLYLTFFKDYTEKVWGIPCKKIGPEWGRQRIKGLSISKAIAQAFKSIFKKDNSLDQKDTETSLIQRFLYPKYGPGQMWEEVAKIVERKGGKIIKGENVTSIEHSGNNITTVKTQKNTYTGDYFFSTMPVQELVKGLSPRAPKGPSRIAKGLKYRDFITVGLLLKKFAKEEEMKDNWIYIQEPDVLVGRLQIFNNWSPYMVKDKNLKWVGLEYFCNEGDSLWNRSDRALKDLAKEEMVKIGLIEPEDILDSTVIRMEKCYPAYFGTYEQFDKVREYLDGFQNLFLIGRNGQHRYNNQDHSMLTAMEAVENILKHKTTKSNIWAVNTESEYHEEKKS